MLCFPDVFQGVSLRAARRKSTDDCRGHAALSLLEASRCQGCVHRTTHPPPRAQHGFSGAERSPARCSPLQPWAGSYGGELRKSAVSALK
eukprot:3672781-Amphidinium_carterae.1